MTINIRIIKEQTGAKLKRIDEALLTEAVISQESFPTPNLSGVDDKIDRVEIYGYKIVGSRVSENTYGLKIRFSDSSGPQKSMTLRTGHKFWNEMGRWDGVPKGSSAKEVKANLNQVAQNVASWINQVLRKRGSEFGQPVIKKVRARLSDQGSARLTSITRGGTTAGKKKTVISSSWVKAGITSSASTIAGEKRQRQMARDMANRDRSVPMGKPNENETREWSLTVRMGTMRRKVDQALAICDKKPDHPACAKAKELDRECSTKLDTRCFNAFRPCLSTYGGFSKCMPGVRTRKTRIRRRRGGRGGACFTKDAAVAAGWIWTSTTARDPAIIKEFQRKLNAAGFFGADKNSVVGKKFPDGKIKCRKGAGDVCIEDGRCGPMTRAAIRAFNETVGETGSKLTAKSWPELVKPTQSQASGPGLEGGKATSTQTRSREGTAWEYEKCMERCKNDGESAEDCRSKCSREKQFGPGGGLGTGVEALQSVVNTLKDKRKGVRFIIDKSLTGVFGAAKGYTGSAGKANDWLNYYGHDAEKAWAKLAEKVQKHLNGFLERVYKDLEVDDTEQMGAKPSMVMAEIWKTNEPKYRKHYFKLHKKMRTIAKKN